MNGILETLFSSRVRAKLLALLFLSPENGLNAHEISLRLGETYSVVWKELARLEKIGVIFSEKVGKAKIFHINPRCPITPELRGLVLKTEGFGDQIRASLIGMQDIHAAFIYGSFASGEVDASSDIDLMVIGELDITRFSEQIARLENQFQRAINYSVFSPTEWQEKLHNQDPFAENVTRSPRVWLIGGEHGV
ncbi:MAG: hypothetical protein GYA20_10615 [Chloroflexi bacterium]|nr:hypothetical protein [Chloroflexota bacterium]